MIDFLALLGAIAALHTYFEIFSTNLVNSNEFK